MKKLQIFALAGLILISTASDGTLTTNGSPESENETKIVLDTTYPFAVKGVTDKTEVKIRPGYSKEQKIAYEKRKNRQKKNAQRKKLTNRSEKIYTKNASANYCGNLNALYQKAAKRFGFSHKWLILAAVHSVETGQRCNTTVRSYAGAQGPFQFMPSTFRSYAVDGDGDGRANIYDLEDSAFTAARYLAANGISRNTRGALFHYNHSTFYVNQVIAVARKFGYRGN